MVSDKQREILAFIERFIEEKGYPPTYEEIRVALEISSKSLVDYHLGVLESAELLTRSPNTPRGIRLHQTESTVSVPVMVETPPKQVLSALSELNPEDVIELTYDIVPSGQNLYALRVQNGARLEALLNEGDILIMQPQTRAKNGELVAARLLDRNELTFRRYYRENGHVRLQPDNPMMQPFIVKPHAVEVQGKVVAVIRQEE
jgi:repressor LexA